MNTARVGRYGACMATGDEAFLAATRSGDEVTLVLTAEQATELEVDLRLHDRDVAELWRSRFPTTGVGDLSFLSERRQRVQALSRSLAGAVGGDK